MKICLVGFMGSGKTAYGAELARQLNYSFYDTDRLIEENENKSINEIFDNEGEDYFRKTEQSILKNILKKDKAVISTGGGLPAFHNNMTLMIAGSLVVFLKPEICELYEWLKNDSSSRPLLRNILPEKLSDTINKLYYQRLPFYRQAQLVISPMYFSPESLANYIRVKST